jgi:molecular chaperone GrpE
MTTNKPTGSPVDSEGSAGLAGGDSGNATAPHEGSPGSEDSEAGGPAHGEASAAGASATTGKDPVEDPVKLRELIAFLEKELEESKQRLHRSLADYDNLRRRSAKEVLDGTAKGAEQFVKKLLPVLDTLDSAMRQIQGAAVDKRVMDGLEMFYIQLSDMLEKEGLKEIPAKGQKFDPNKHEALCTRHLEDQEDEIVLTELVKGYTFKDRVVRPAQVEINQR